MIMNGDYSPRIARVCLRLPVVIRVWLRSGQGLQTGTLICLMMWGVGSRSITSLSWGSGSSPVSFGTNCPWSWPPMLMSSFIRWRRARTIRRRPPSAPVFVTAPLISWVAFPASGARTTASATVSSHHLLSGLFQTWNWYCTAASQRVEGLIQGKLISIFAFRH